MRDPPPAPSQQPILLIHGVLGNAGGIRSNAGSTRVRRPGLRRMYGPPLARSSFADQAAARIDEILTATGARQVIAVAHSMGGLVMRAYLRKFGGAKVARLVTIATPHEGRQHAWLAVGAARSRRCVRAIPGLRTSGYRTGWRAADRLAVVVARLDGHAADVLALLPSARMSSSLPASATRRCEIAPCCARAGGDRGRRAVLPVNPLGDLRGTRSVPPTTAAARPPSCPAPLPIPGTC